MLFMSCGDDDGCTWRRSVYVECVQEDGEGDLHVIVVEIDM